VLQCVLQCVAVRQSPQFRTTAWIVRCSVLQFFAVRLRVSTCVLEFVSEHVCCVLQHEVVCCSVLQCFVVCCSVLQCVAICLRVNTYVLGFVLPCVAVCCSAVQFVAVRCSVLQYVCV